MIAQDTMLWKWDTKSYSLLFSSRSEYSYICLVAVRPRLLWWDIKGTGQFDNRSRFDSAWNEDVCVKVIMVSL